MPPDTCWSLIREKKERKPSGKRDIKDFQGLAVGERLPHTWNTNYVSQRNATLIFVASLTYTSPVLAPFSRSRREEEGGEEEIACTTNTLIHTHARVILCLFASFLLPLFCFFLLLFFSRIKRRGNVSPRIISSIEHEFPEYSIRKQITTRNNLERNDTSTRVRNSSSRSIRGGTTEGEMHVDCWLTFLEFLSSPLLSSSPKTCVTCPRPRDDGLRRYERVQDSRLVDLEIS